MRLDAVLFALVFWFVPGAAIAILAVAGGSGTPVGRAYFLVVGFILMAVAVRTILRNVARE